MPITEQRQLSALIEKELAELNLPESPALLYDPVRYTLDLPGKRIRPFLTLAGCGLSGGDIEEALPGALALELLHNFTLLHDDIMDGAHTRRGEPSVFKKWDANTAILSGDAMYAKAFKQLQYYGQSDSYSKKQYADIIDVFLDSAERVCEGQALDLAYEQRQKVTLDDYLQMINGKTAALISGSLVMGGTVAGAEASVIDQLKIVGQKAGIAFQIQDDLLDAVADPEKFGKQRGGDIVEGKKTYLSLLALQRCNAEQKKSLNSILATNKTSADDVSRVIDLYEELGVISATQDIIRRYYEQAMEPLSTFKSSPYKNEIITLLNRLISREY